MSPVVKGPWRPRAVETATGMPRAEAVIRAVAVALIALLAGFVLSQAIGEPAPEPTYQDPAPNGRTVATGDGARYFAREDLSEGVWRAVVASGQECGYKRTSASAKVTDSSVKGPATLTVVVDPNTLYVDFNGPCRWVWVGHG